MKLENALSIAQTVIGKLNPHCSIINIAGQCRRRKLQVKDIQIVALPKTILADDSPLSLFPEITSERLVSPGYIETVKRLGTISFGRPEDRYRRIELSEGITLDLFTPEEIDYYGIYALRTGSEKCVSKIIVPGWNKISWCASDKGLRKKSDCRYNKSSKTWKCVNRKAELPPAWKSEKEFFEWIRVKWIQPELRV